MKVVVSVQDVVNEMDLVSDEHAAYLNRQTGELVTLSDEELSAAEDDDDPNDYPEWQREMIAKAKEIIASDDYLPLPSKYDIHEYHIIEEFCMSIDDDAICEELLEKIRGRGAFRRFKDAIEMHGIQETWHRFRQEELEKIAIEWLDENEIPYSRDKHETDPLKS